MNAWRIGAQVPQEILKSFTAHEFTYECSEPGWILSKGKKVTATLSLSTILEASWFQINFLWVFRYSNQAEKRETAKESRRWLIFLLGLRKDQRNQKFFFCWKSHRKNHENLSTFSFGECWFVCSSKPPIFWTDNFVIYHPTKQEFYPKKIENILD